MVMQAMWKIVLTAYPEPYLICYCQTGIELHLIT